MNEIAGMFGRVVCGSTADTGDLNLSMDSVGIIVCEGNRIEEKMEIIWKGSSFDVWVSEIDETWYPGYIKSSNVRYVSVSPASQSPAAGPPMLRLNHRRKKRVILGVW
ncbi:hypothetical protein Hanom_Chr06g00502631 [Helianthus anomalus]